MTVDIRLQINFLYGNNLQIVIVVGIIGHSHKFVMLPLWVVFFFETCVRHRLAT